jgi:hypothetical protein
MGMNSSKDKKTLQKAWDVKGFDSSDFLSSYKTYSI